jgi:DNA binding domain, excisionase family
MTDEIMDINELSEYLKISKSTIYKFTQAKKIPFRRVGRNLRYLRSEIDQWIDEGGNMIHDDTKGYGSQSTAPPSLETKTSAETKTNSPKSNRELEFYFSQNQVQLLSTYSITTLTKLILLLATNRSREKLAAILELDLEELDQIATRIIKEFHS